jgi:hypothetical protein
MPQADILLVYRLAIGCRWRTTDRFARRLGHGGNQ